MTAAALVRGVPATLGACELTWLERAPIDVDRARRQHAGYVAALRSAGLEVLELPPDDALPDCPFVEDVAVDLGGGRRVLCNPGAESRRPERSAVRAALQRRGELLVMPDDLTLDGGDVLAVGDRLWVGLSTRTSEAAIAWLEEVAGREVVRVALDGVLHLKTGVTAVDDRTLLVAEGAVDLEAFAGFEVLYAADPNVLRLQDRVVARPATAALLRRERPDLRVQEVAISELARAEAGMTCLSVLLSDR